MATRERPSWLNHILDSLRTELAIASIRSLALVAASKIFILLSSIMLARWLGAEGFGIYASAVAAAIVLAIFAQLGLPTLLIRVLPVYEVRQKWGLMRGLLRRTNVVVIVSSLVLAGAAAAIVLGVDNSISVTQKFSWLWAAALVPIVCLTSMSASALRGLRHVVAGQIPEALVIPGLLFVLIIGWWTFGDQLGLVALSPDAAVALRLTVTVIALLVGGFLLVRRMPPQVHSSVAEYDTTSWVRAAIPLFVLSGAAIMTTETDVLMLVALQGNAPAGIYQPTARGAEFVAFSLFVVSGVVQPTISRLYELGDLRRLQVVVTAAARFALVSALPVALLFIVFAQPILEFVYGEEFGRGAVSLMILSAAQVINVSAGVVGHILIMTGHMRDAAIGMILGAVVNIGLNAVLIPRWEIEGAAMATAISLVVWNIYLAVRVRSRTGLASSVFGKRSDRAG